MCRIWYAVLVELDSVYSEGHVELGTDPTGRLRYVSLHYAGTDYSILYRCGYALEAMAQEKAEEYGGRVLELCGVPYCTSEIVEALKAE